VYQFLHLLAGGAHAATVGLSAVRAEDILCVSQGQRQFATSGRAQKQLSVRDMVFSHTLDEPLLDGRLSYDVFELHGLVFRRAKIQFSSIYFDKKAIFQIISHISEIFGKKYYFCSINLETKYDENSLHQDHRTE
jgi:YHS domain-containing protein